MEMTTDGAIRGGFKSDRDKYDLEITTITRMIEEFCSDLFSPETLKKLPKNRKDSGFTYVKANSKFIVSLSDMYIIDIPKQISFKEYYRMQCTVGFYTLKDYPNTTNSDILAGLGMGKFGPQCLKYEQTFYINKNELFDNDRVIFHQVNKDYIAGGKQISGPRKDFIDNLLDWSHLYLYNKANGFWGLTADLVNENSKPISKDEVMEYLKNVDIDTYMDIFARTLHEQIHNIMHTDELFAGKDKLTPSDLFAILKIVKQPHVFETVRIMGDK